MKTKKKFGMRRHIGITAAATLIALGATACEEAYWGKTDGESNKKIYDDFVKHFGSEDGSFSATLVKNDNENCLLNKAQGGKLDCRTCKPNDSKCNSCIKDAERDGCDDFQALIELDSILDYKILLSDGDGKKTEAMIAMCSSWSDKNHTIKIELDKYGQVNLVDGVKIGDDTTAITDICTLDKEICDGKFKKLTCDSVSYYSIGQDGKYSKCENGKCSDITLPSIEMPPVFLSGFNYRVCPVGYDYRTEYVYDLRNVCVKSTCNNASVNLYTDNLNCGGCGIVCKDGVICENGNCKDTCKSDQILCNGQCIDPQTDNRYCGANQDCTSYKACPNGEVCSVGTCGLTCVSGQIICGDKCIDPEKDNEYCGATGDCKDLNAGEKCDSGKVCSGGTCGTSCLSGQVLCGDKCIVPEKDNEYCGATGDCKDSNAGEKCASGEVCSGGTCGASCLNGQILCNGQCIDPDTDNRYCGANGNCSVQSTETIDNSKDPNFAGSKCKDGEVCSAGKCGTSCLSSQVLCGGKCIVPETDNAYCGASSDCKDANAGSNCKDGEVCSGGTCSVTCVSGQVLCGGKCILPETDNTYCGAKGKCNNTSASSNDYKGATCASGEVCSGGTCGASCLSGQVLCGGKCIVPETDNAYCGAKGKCNSASDSDANYRGKACTNGTKCSEGRCVVTCTSNQIVCGEQCVEPSSSKTNCGAKGKCNNPNVNSQDYQGALCDGDQVCAGGKCVKNSCNSAKPCREIQNGVNQCISGECKLSCNSGYVLNVEQNSCTMISDSVCGYSNGAPLNCTADKSNKYCDKNTLQCVECLVQEHCVSETNNASIVDCTAEKVCKIYQCDDGFVLHNNTCVPTVERCGTSATDCTKIPNVLNADSVSCDNGFCVVTSCKPDSNTHVYNPSNGHGQCEANSKDHCGSHDYKCNDANATNISCQNGFCKIEDCNGDYHVCTQKEGVNNGHDICHKNETNECGKSHENCSSFFKDPQCINGVCSGSSCIGEKDGYTKCEKGNEALCLKKEGSWTGNSWPDDCSNCVGASNCSNGKSCKRSRTYSHYSYSCE